MKEDLRLVLLGQSDAHVTPWRDSGLFVHSEIVPALESMRSAAAADGLDLRVCSGFRSFERQVAIWNAKATGQRPILSENGTPMDFATLTTEQILSGILRWSALPGASRHHWGTDIDVYDAASVPADYRVQLTMEEALTHFARLHAWLDANMARFGFFRPYARDLGGIAPEAWHLSYAPLSQSFFEAYSFSILEAAIRETDLTLKDTVLQNLPHIFERYFLRVSAP